MVQRDLSPSSTSSMLSNITVRTEKHADLRAISSASPSISTPPTSLDDAGSVMSESTKLEQVMDVVEAAAPAQPTTQVQGAAVPAPAQDNTESRRPARSSRKSVTTYNVQILAGTAIHTPTKYLEKHHKNVLHGDIAEVTPKANIMPARKKFQRRKSEPTRISDPIEDQLIEETNQAAQRRTSSRVTDLRKEALRNISGVGDIVANKLSQGNGVFEGILRRSASDSRLKSSARPPPAQSALKRARAAETEDSDSQEPEKEYLKPKTKTWIKQGLFVGQHRDFNPRLSEASNRAKKRSKKPTENTTLPLPIFACDRMLNEDPKHVYRDFKLPFDTYNPLPRKVKPDGWIKLHKNRFIGEASALWKRDKQDESQCYCTPEDGCGEACHNRIMAYECDSTNCPLTSEQCRNRPFAELKKRSKGNRYDYGVEVVDTEDRGFGVRAMRTFEPHQIIVEYAGEIITQQECERRTKQIYKRDKCYYLMSFDNKMIIDASRGTIARFVNHCCEPNCEMIKWTVGGEPRMALFAGRNGIMTGEELTYDYNFDPFSQKNIQECRCGTESCRGVLGPKPKKPVEEKSLASVVYTGTKRKLQELFGSARGGSESAPNSPKKRKVLMASSANTKQQNAFAETQAAIVRAERKASEHSRQIASRENRALQRNTTGPKSKRIRAAGSRVDKPSAIKVMRQTTVTFKHKVPKAGMLKSIKKSAKVATSTRRTPAGLKGQKGIRPSKRPSTPVQDSEMETESEEEINITPASLRSASKKVNPFSPVPTKLPKSMAQAVSKGTKKSQQRGSAATPRGLHSTGAGVKKAYQKLQGRARMTKAR